MENVVITGAASFIGTHWGDALVERGYSVIAVVRPGSQASVAFKEKYPFVKAIELSMSDYAMLADFIEPPIDAFFSLSWNGTRGIDRSDEEKQKQNYDASLMALHAAIQLGVKTFITAGSQAEYGMQEGLIDEHCIERPSTAYGKEKLHFYLDAAKICEQNNIRLIEPRFFSLYGPGDFEGTLVMSALRKMLHDEPCDFTDCEQMWNFMNVRDAASALVYLVEHAEILGGVYNFASTDTRQLKRFILEMKQITKSHSELHFGAIPHNDNGSAGLQPSVSKLLITGWQTHISFEQGIEEIMSEYVR